MTSNGYTADELVDGPQNSWIGHYSLAQQGVDVGDFESFITENAPVTFTDATVRSRNKILDPPICYFRLIPTFVDTWAISWSPAKTGSPRVLRMDIVLKYGV